MGNLKKMRIAALAAMVCAGLAIVPGSALAAGGIKAESYPTTIVSEDPGLGHYFTLGESQNTCSVGVLESTTLSEPSATVAMEPYWTECTSPVEASGCKFELHAGTESSFDIGPAGCGPITTEIGPCEVSIGAQTGLPATFENTGEGSSAEIRVSVSTLLEYTRKGVSCGAGTFNDLGFSSSWDLAGFDSGTQNPVVIEAVDGFNGFFLSSGQFTAESFPISLTATQYHSGPFGEYPYRIKVNEKLVECDAVEMSSSLSEASSTVTLDPTFSDCEYDGSTPVTVEANSCDLRLSVTAEGNGKVGVVCDTEGDTFDITWPTEGTCVIRFGAQTPESGDSLLGTFGEGSARHVAVTTMSSKLSYSREGNCAAVLGSEGTGGFAGSLSVRGP